MSAERLTRCAREKISHKKMTRALHLNFEQDNLVADIPKAACRLEAGITGSTGVVEGAFNSGMGISLHTKGDCVKEIYVAAPQSNRVFIFDTCGATAENTILVTGSAGVTGGIVGVPQGVLYNDKCCLGFDIVDNGNTGCAKVITFQQDGVIGGFNEDVNALFTIPVVVGPLGSNYTAGVFHKKYLYAVNFGTGEIEKYDSNWALVSSFTDQGLVDAGYHPYGIEVVRICGKKRLVVTFTNTTATPGLGEGYVDVFCPDGSFHRLINRGPLNVPYAIFGLCIDNTTYLGIGNNGDGRINFFTPKCGTWLSTAEDKYCNIISIDGLFGVAPDPEKAVLYFAAAVSDGVHGLFGRLTNK